MAGVKGRSGRKSQDDEMALHSLMQSCWKVADREAAFCRLSYMAREGNIEAMKLLCLYAYGRPKQIEASDHPVNVMISYATPSKEEIFTTKKR